MSPIDTSLLREIIVVIALAIARTTGLLLVTPFLGRGMLTGLARNGVILALSLPLLRLAWQTRPLNLDPSHLPLIVALGLKELVIGVLLGLPIAVASWGMEAAGAFIDNQRGATMASSLNPATGNQASPIGILLGQVYVTWLFVTGGFLALLETLYSSHQIWPMWSFQPALGPAFGAAALQLLDSVMRLGLLFAGPAIIAMFLSELGLALVSRFAPQLQVFFLAMPVKSAVGLLLLILSLGIILTEAGRRLPTPQGILGTMGQWLP